MFSGTKNCPARNHGQMLGEGWILFKKSKKNTSDFGMDTSGQCKTNSLLKFQRSPVFRSHRVDNAAFKMVFLSFYFFLVM